MRPRFTPLIISLTWSVFLCLAQQPGTIKAQVVPPDDLDAKSKAYINAYQIWLKGDPSLEADLTKKDKADMIRRIEEDDRRATDFLSARKAYFQSLLNSYSGKVKSLNEAKEADNVRQNVEAFRSSVQQQKTQLGRDSENIKKELSLVPNTKDVNQMQLRQAMESRIEALDRLRLNLDDQLQAVEDSKQNDESLEQSRQKVLGGSQSVITELEKELKDVDRMKELWSGYHKTLRSAVENRVATPVVTPPPPPPPPPATQGPVTALPETGPAPPPVPTKLTYIAGGNLAGVWEYKSGVFRGSQPVTVTVEIKEQAGFFRGTLTGKFLPNETVTLVFRAVAKQVVISQSLDFVPAPGSDLDASVTINASGDNDPNVIDFQWNVPVPVKGKISTEELVIQRKR